MASLPVVEDFYVFGDLPDSLFPCCIALVMNKLVLEGTPEAFHRSIIVTVALPAHGRLHTEPFEELLVFRAAVLASPIRMMDEAWGRPFGSHCVQQRLSHKDPGA